MKLLPPEAPLFENAGTEVLEHDVRVPHELAHDVLPPRQVQVERHQLLVAVVDGEPVRLALFGGAEAAQIVAAAGHLGLDHLGAELGHERAAERAGHDLRQLQHADAFQRPGCAHADSSPDVTGTHAAGSIRSSTAAPTASRPPAGAVTRSTASFPVSRIW